MTIEQVATKNVLCIAFSAWGHIRPMCSLAALIAQEPRHHITFLCIPFLFDRVLKELGTHFPSTTPKELEELITVIAVTANESEWMESFRDEYYFTITQAFNDLSVKCGKTAKVHTVPVPDIMIGDPLHYQTLAVVRKTLPASVKCLAFAPGSAYGILSHYGPEKYGGFGDLEAKTIQELQRSGIDVVATANAVFYDLKGSVVDVPGLPPYYDHEVHPQLSYYPQYAVIHLQGHRYLNECDGAIVMSSSEIEPEAVRILKEWFAETGRPFYAIGPLLPVKHYEDGHNDLIAGPVHNGTQETLDFLDATLQKHGPKSLIYISFGTIFWSTKPEMIYSLIDEVILAGFPFLLTHASSTSKNMPNEVKEKINASDLGLLTTWSPQRNVLAHPATGWFISHCGQNSFLEAITYGVPIIAWPYEFDQPLNAMLISLVHEVGYELLQIRTGEKGLKKLYRCEAASLPDANPKDDEAAWCTEMRKVLTRARGEDGQQRRSNMQTLRERVIAGWQEGGETLQAFQAFLKWSGGEKKL